MASHSQPDGDHEKPCPPPSGGRFREPSMSRLFLGGAAGTMAMTVMMFLVEPIISGRSSDLGRLFGGELGSPHWVGLIMFHFFNGSILFPLGLAFFSARLPGPWLIKGLIWGALLWLLAQGVIMPMSGFGFFSYNAGRLAAVSSLASHLVYGGIQGLIAGIPGRKDD
jgi:hypothetical protein